MVTGAVTVNVPPQVALEALLTVSPVGSVSVKPTPVDEAGLPAGLVMVNVRLVDPFRAMVLAANAFAIEGGPSTARVAVPVFPVPALVEVTCTLLLNEPTVLPCTLTETEHEPPPAIEPPDRLTEPAPPVAVTVPPQLLVAPGDEASAIPVGKVSVNATPVNARLALGFVIVSVKVLDPPSATEVGLKLLAIDGGEATVKLADAVLPVPPLVEVTVPVVLV